MKDAATHTMKAWQCIGCGRLEAPQTCIGVCQDRKVELVYAGELTEAREEIARLAARLHTLQAFAQRVAWSTPRDGAWERSYRSVQAEARKLLAARPDEVMATVPAPAGELQ